MYDVIRNTCEILNSIRISGHIYGRIFGLSTLFHRIARNLVEVVGMSSLRADKILVLSRSYLVQIGPIFGRLSGS